MKRWFNRYKIPNVSVDSALSDDMSQEALTKMEQQAKNLQYLPTEEVYRTIGDFDKNVLKRAYQDDLFLQNYFLNLWEYATGQDVLESYPWNITLPLADVCNARCTFCDAWLRGEGVMQPEDVDRFASVLKFAKVFGLQGHGEPLANPHIDTILTKIGNLVDPRARAYIITNGAYLEKRLDLLLRARVEVFNLSLNATSSATHDVVMGLGANAFESVISSIRKLIALKGQGHPSIEVTISMVLTQDNLHEASDFIRLGNELGVNRIYIRSLMPMSEPEAVVNWDTAVIVPPGLNYHLIPPYLHPDFTSLTNKLREDIASSVVPVEAQPDTWSTPVLSKKVIDALNTRSEPIKFITRKEALADEEIRKIYKAVQKKVHGRGEYVEEVANDGPNPYNREPHFYCRYIYHNLICNETSFRLVPCCYMADVPGHAPVVFDGANFMDYWNSPAFVRLRRSLREGTLFNACKTCPNQG